MRKDSNNDKLRDIAHFLLVNSEFVDTIKNSYPKTVLIHFFFLYAYKYEKQVYANFAFKLLQLSLSEIFSLKQEIKDYNPEIIGIGQGVMYFIDNGFFESEELNELLFPLDRLAIRETERLSRGEFSSNNVYRLLSIADYLLSRLEYIDSGTEHSFVVKEYLLTAFFELVHHIDNWDHTDITWTLSLYHLLKKSTGKKEVAHLAQKGLQHLENDFFQDIEQKLKLFTPENLNGDLDRFILLSLCFSKTIKDIGDNQKQLEKAIKVKIYLCIEQLYQDETNIPSLHVQRVIIYATILITGKESQSPGFLIHAILKLIRNNNKALFK